MQENYENHWSEFGVFSWRWDQSEDKVSSRTWKIIDLNWFSSIEIASINNYRLEKLSIFAQVYEK